MFKTKIINLETISPTYVKGAFYKKYDNYYFDTYNWILQPTFHLKLYVKAVKIR